MRKLLALLMLPNLIFHVQSHHLHKEVSDDHIYKDLRDLGGSCAIVDGCKENLNSSSLRFLNCHCDSTCMELDTCCLDSPFMQHEHHHPRTDLECFNGYYGVFHVFMVVNCRSDWLDDGVTARMCLTNGKESDDPFLDLPVTSLKTGISYKNYFCSVCNEDIVDGDQLVPWDILIKETANLATSSDYAGNLDKSPNERNTPTLVTDPTWTKITTPSNSQTEPKPSNLNTSPTVKDRGDPVTDPNSRETIDLITNPIIKEIDLGTSPSIESITTFVTSSTGQEKNGLLTGNNGEVGSKVTMETRDRMIRSVTGETVSTTRPVMPVLKYNASLQTWKVQLQNSSTVPVTVTMELPNKAWKFVKTCHPELISECSKNWTDASTAQKCSSYMFLTRIQRNGTTFRYRNPHCAICNHESLDNVDCVEETLGLFGMGGSTELYEAFFVGLFVLEDRKKKCGRNMVYDSLFKKCRVVNCPQNHTFKDKKCVKDAS